MSGSSPLTRGKRQRSTHRPWRVRLIPAHAGKTLSRRARTRAFAAHPRSRGENARPLGCPRARAGSSPLTRGKHNPRLPKIASRRLIPAHAGKTNMMLVDSEGRRAHPRSRGENPPAASPRNTGGGSSPLTRGKPCVIHARMLCARLIPAHAGKTSARFFPLVVAQAHPRSRGENSQGVKRPSSAVGSSPLTRGKRPRTVKQQLGPRLIPAHAGKTR